MFHNLIICSGIHDALCKRADHLSFKVGLERNWKSHIDSLEQGVVMGGAMNWLEQSVCHFRLGSLTSSLEMRN